MHPTWEDFTRSVKCLTALRLVYMLGGCRKDPPVLTADLAVHKPFNKLCHLKNMVAVALLVKSSYLIQPFLFYFISVFPLSVTDAVPCLPILAEPP